MIRYFFYKNTFGFAAARRCGRAEIRLSQKRKFSAVVTVKYAHRFFAFCIMLRRNLGQLSASIRNRREQSRRPLYIITAHNRANIKALHNLTDCPVFHGSKASEMHNKKTSVTKIKMFQLVTNYRKVVLCIRRLVLHKTVECVIHNRYIF